MNVKRKFIAGGLVFGLSAVAHAQLGGLGGMLGGGRGGSGDAAGLIDRFNIDAALISKAVAFALIQIQAALKKKEDMADVKKHADSLTKPNNPQEANALQGTIIKTQAAETLELMKSAEAKERLEKLSPEMQKKTGEAILAVAIASLKIPGLLDNGKKAVEGAGANPMLLPKLVTVKDGMSMLADAAPKIGPIVTTGFALMREIKVDPGNPSKDTPLKSDMSISIPDA